MDVQQFEQAILKLAFETDARITPASVAYYLGLPTRQTNQLLNELLQEGALELDSDADGNLFYVLPNHGGVGAEVLRPLRESIQRDVREALPGHLRSPAHAPTPEHEEAPRRPAERPPVPEHVPDAASGTHRVATEFSGVSLVGPEDSDDVEAIAPRSASRERKHSGSFSAAEFGADAVVGRSTPNTPPAEDDPRDEPASGYAVFSADDGMSEAARLLGSGVIQTHNKRARRDIVTGHKFTSDMETDASVDSGRSIFIVTDASRCEPKPLPTERPIIASCIDPAEEDRITRAREERANQLQWWRPEEQHNPGAMVLADHHEHYPAPLEQPEHQPGMALLLSLILCGTGQIYNGEVSKGIMMMVLCFLLWFVLLGWVIHIWSIVDAVVVAERINRRQHV